MFSSSEKRFPLSSSSLPTSPLAILITASCATSSFLPSSLTAKLHTSFSTCQEQRASSLSLTFSFLSLFLLSLSLFLSFSFIFFSLFLSFAACCIICGHKGRHEEEQSFWQLKKNCTGSLYNLHVVRSFIRSLSSFSS